ARERSAPAVAATVVGRDAKFPFELRHDQEPRGLVDARAVDEHERSSASGQLVTKLDPVDGDHRHGLETNGTPVRLLFQRTGMESGDGRKGFRPAGRLRITPSRG